MDLSRRPGFLFARIFPLLPLPIKMPRYHVQISAPSLNWPGVCACCREAADTIIEDCESQTVGKQLAAKAASGWAIPYCSYCIEHIGQHHIGTRTMYAGAFVAGFVALCVGDFYHSVLAGLAGGLFVLAAFVKASRDYEKCADSLRAPECQGVGPAVECQGSFGTSHEFVFSNPAFLELFRQSNPRNAISDVTLVE